MTVWINEFHNGKMTGVLHGYPDQESAVKRINSLRLARHIDPVWRAYAEYDWHIVNFINDAGDYEIAY